jgi:hypothetical protein
MLAGNYKEERMTTTTTQDVTAFVQTLQNLRETLPTTALTGRR